MKKSVRWMAIIAATLVHAPQVLAQPVQRESTSVYIRRLAGLPAESANGQVEILDVGHGPLDTMLSIVANRTRKGWSVSYACASSPQCATDQDHRAISYPLLVRDSVEVDKILKALEGGLEPDGQPPSPSFIGGYLLVSLNDHGFKRDYRRVGVWGHTLGKLETLLSPPAASFPQAILAGQSPTATPPPIRRKEKPDR